MEPDKLGGHNHETHSPPLAESLKLAGFLLVLPLLMMASFQAMACPAGSNNGATHTPSVPDHCFSDKSNGIRNTTGLPPESCRCRSWATVRFSTLGGENSFQVNIVDGDGNQIQPTATWPYPGGLRIDYEIVINDTVNKDYLTMSADLQAVAVPASRLVTGGPGGSPMPGIRDGDNNVTFRITGGSFMSSDIAAIFGGGEAMLPHMAHPFTISGESRSINRTIAFSSTE